MKKDLLGELSQAIDLLSECGWEDKAEWFRKRATEIESFSEGSREFQKALEEIEAILGGMGSFSDLPLYPGRGSKLTLDEARARQWALVDKLGELIQLLKTHRVGVSEKARLAPKSLKGVQ